MKHTIKRLIAGLFGLILLQGVAGAAEDFEVTDIQVQGLQRISAGTVFNYLPIKVGDRVSEDEVNEALKALFETGFFQDIELERDAGVLIVKVGSATLLQLGATGALFAGPDGIAALLTLSAGGGGGFGGSGFAFDANLTFELNTTNMSQSATIGGRDVMIDAGVYARIEAIGALSFLLPGVDSGFKIDGAGGGDATFVFEIGSNGLQIAATAAFELVIAGNENLSDDKFLVGLGWLK